MFEIGILCPKSGKEMGKRKKTNGLQAERNEL